MSTEAGMGGVEPWLRGTLREVPAVGRAVVHALELAMEDVRKWCEGLSDGEMEARLAGLAPVGFHLRHAAGSLDRLLTYAEGRELDAGQMERMAGEMTAAAGSGETIAEFERAMAEGMRRVRALCVLDLEGARFVGRRRLPTSLGGLLVHVAEHTGRHVGQAVTTAKMVVAARGGG
ncbi:MAG TPA: DinB family protein [Candidatus Acidoferrum sp.]|nr:DinB family protein [Candidatus Acidoferrum sp.]